MTSTPVFRRAVAADLEAIVAMLADDILGQERENTSLPLAQSYLDAFEAIEADPNQYLAVVELDGTVVGTLQISYMPGLSHQGAWRGEIESVRIASSARG
ncbi:GNAT family N-acetyltransferase, partial [Alcaligenes faecalis]|uniref:GNAT family N-acetyltransferase n=1 Tax=Alcaligenes faecalis TaxID=511 RepID=UPI002FC59234